MTQSLSIVVPVFNEQEVIANTFDRLLAMTGLAPVDRFETIELIFVNDGSDDGTASKLESIRQSPMPPRVTCTVLHFARNFGHSAAVVAGLRASTGGLVAVMDADLQDPPEVIPQMCEFISAGYDVVYGQRVARAGEGWFKRLSAWAFYRVLRSVTGVDIPKDAGDFRVMTREVCDAVLECQEQEPFLRGLVAWVGFNQKAFPYNRNARTLGTTKYPLHKMARFAVKAIVSFSDVPLTVAFYVGNLGFLFGLFVTCWALWVHATGRVVPGWTSLLLGFVFGNSLMLIVLGAVGLYLGQVFKNVQSRPLYIVRKQPPPQAKC